MAEIEGTEGTTPEGTTPESAPETGEKLLSQADVDRIVRDRLARQKAQFSDYDDLKAKAAKFEEFEASQKSELEKAQERAAQLEAQAAAATERAQRVVTESALIAAATGKLTDPSDALAFIDKASIEYGEDGAPINVAALVEALVEAKPHLAAQRRTPSVDQGARGGAKGLDDAAIMALDDADFQKAMGLT